MTLQENRYTEWQVNIAEKIKEVKNAFNHFYKNVLST